MDYNEIINNLQKSQQQYIEVFNQQSPNNKRKKFYFNGLFKQQQVLWEVNLFAKSEEHSDRFLQFYRLSHIFI
jgi:hypothetical protein